MPYYSHGARALTHDIADGVVLAARGHLNAALFSMIGAGSPTVTLYDNATAPTGTKIATLKLQGNTPFFATFDPLGVELQNGLWVTASNWNNLTVTLYARLLVPDL